MLNANYILYDRNFVILGYGGGFGSISDASDNTWEQVDTYPDGFFDGFMPGKWMYNPDTHEIYLNPIYPEKTAEGLVYDWETHDWIPNPWI